MKYSLRLFLPVLLFSALAAAAADMSLEAKLVWGTNDEKHDPNFRPVDAELAGKLHCAFKWKNYYEITNQAATVALHKSCELKMSDHCTLRVKNVGAPRVEVHCIGEGKEVHHGAYNLESSGWLVLGGNANNDTAWFIGLRAAPDPKKAITSK